MIASNTLLSKREWPIKEEPIEVMDETDPLAEEEEKIPVQLATKSPSKRSRAKKQPAEVPAVRRSRSNKNTSEGSTKDGSSNLRLPLRPPAKARSQERKVLETNEHRNQRLKNLREYSRKRCDQETGEQREKRLADMKLRQKLRLLQESSVDRAMRLERLKLYYKKKVSKKTKKKKSVSDSKKEQSHGSSSQVKLL